MDLETAPNYINYWKDVKIKNKKYEWLSASFSTSFCKEGIDKRGLTYYTSVGNGYHIDLFAHPEIPFEYIVAVLDPWTHEVYICELPPGNWNPARNSKGFIAVNSSCIDFDGNFYLTDCNKEKGCYEIKKLSNDWLKKYDFYKREVGRMNANHIPLQLEAKSSAKNNGYNFDHEYLWILEHKSDWCKVRKVDGREGWVETRYINFDEGNKASSSYKTSVNTNVSENRIMACNDNLRLRKEEATSSAVITTMQKGTKVKILKLGKAETIDGISSNWVQVEVLADAKDKDGATIKAGTRGWCYGGYLD
ncbi:MAG: SH3 domain-containing protein [Treponema sp.]|nr:SH3 domain-containing protein [Treponema sp.]